MQPAKPSPPRDIIEDVDLERFEIHVRQDIWHGHLDSPKSEASAATVPMGSRVASVLQGHLARLEWASGFLFSNNQGRPLDPKYLAQKQLYPAQDRLGLPRFSWHTLRHLHATRLEKRLQGFETG